MINEKWRFSMDFYKFWEILNEQKGIKNEWDPNEPDEGPEDHVDYPSASGAYEMTIPLKFEKGVFRDLNDGRTFPPIPHPPLNNIIENPEDTYTLETRIAASGYYIPGNDQGGGFSRDDEFRGEPSVEIDGFHITNDRTKKTVDVPTNLIEDKVIGTTGRQKSTYEVDIDLNGDKIEISVR